MFTGFEAGVETKDDATGERGFGRISGTLYPAGYVYHLTPETVKPGSTVKYVLTFRPVYKEGSTVTFDANGKATKSYRTLKSTVVKVGQKVKIKTVVTPADQKLKLSEHRAVRYVSSNKSVATVTAKGRGVVKGVKPGTCYIRAYVQNGVSKLLKVTVK